MQKQLTGTVAVLLKRGWVDESAQERHAFFSEVESTVAGTSDAAARRTGIEVLEVSLLAHSSLLLTACMQTDRHPNLHCVECACNHMPHVRSSQINSKLVMSHCVSVHDLSACRDVSWQASLSAEPAVAMVNLACL